MSGNKQTQPFRIVIFFASLAACALIFARQTFALTKIPEDNTAIPNGTVYAQAVASDGSVYLGGSFTQITQGGTTYTRNRLAHIMADGSVDQNFSPAANDIVYALALTSTTLYAGGEFTVINGSVSRNNAAAFNRTDGSLTSWDPNVQTTRTVYALAISGDTIYLGGGFNNVNNGTSRSNLAATNLTDGTATSWNPRADGVVYALLAHNNQIFAGGSFSNVNSSVSRSKLAAFNTTDGTVTSWNPNANNEVYALALLGSNILIGGNFTQINSSISKNKLALVDSTTGTVQDWASDSTNTDVKAIAVFDNSIFIGGTSNTLYELSKTTGATQSWITSNLEGGSVYSFGVTPAYAGLYVGGSFSSIAQTSKTNLALFGSTSVSQSQAPSSSSENQNWPSFYSLPIMAGPNHLGIATFITGGTGTSGGEGKILITNTANRHDVHVNINPVTLKDLPKSKITSTPPWQQGLNTVSEIMEFKVDSSFNGYPIISLDNPATIIVSYNPLLVGANQKRLRLAYFDLLKNRWVVIPRNTVIDYQNNLIANTQTAVSTYYAVILLPPTL